LQQSFLIEHFVAECCSNVYSLFHVIGEAVANEIFAFVADEALLGVGEVDHAGLQHYSLVEDAHLAHLVSEGFFAEDHLVVDHADRPHVDLGRDHCLLVGHEAFGGKVPVCAHALGGQLEVLVFGCFAEAEICDLGLSFMEEDVLGFEVVVNHLVWQLVQILYCAHHLPQY
jgi:hypothetical protein